MQKPSMLKVWMLPFFFFCALYVKGFNAVSFSFQDAILNNGAYLANSSLVLSDEGNLIKGSAMFPEPILLNNRTASACVPNPFSVSFNFQSYVVTDKKADGFAFNLNPMPKWYAFDDLPQGYSYYDMLGVEFSFSRNIIIVRKNRYYTDIANLTVVQNGTFDLSDETVKYVWVDFNTSSINVFLSHEPVKPPTFLLSSDYDPCPPLTSLERNSLYCGFSSYLSNSNSSVTITDGFEFNGSLTEEYLIRPTNGTSSETTNFTIPFDVDHLDLHRNASIEDGVIILTDGQHHTGGVMYNTALQILSFSGKNNSTCTSFDFSTSFRFAMHAQSTDICPDGLAFVLSPVRNWTLTPGGFLGYVYPLLQSLVVEFDTYKNENADVASNHVGIDLDGSLLSSGYTIIPTPFCNNKTKYVRIEYVSADNLLNVYLDENGYSDSVILSYSIDTCQHFGNLSQEYFYIGFAATTADQSMQIEILQNWTWQSKLTPAKKSSSNLTLIISLTVTSVIVVLFVIFLILFFFYRKKIIIKKEDPIESKLALVLQKKTAQFMSLKRIEDATNGFNDRNIIGKGGFGNVYKGIDYDGTVMAIKRLKNLKEEAYDAFVKEVDAISSINHSNLVKLIGFCDESNERIMVYEFLPNGTLRQRLRVQNNVPPPKNNVEPPNNNAVPPNDGAPGKSSGVPVNPTRPNYATNVGGDYGTKFLPLSFDERMKIATGVSEGLKYLHTFVNPPLIHRDIKSENILLNANMEGVIVDFGLSKNLTKNLADVDTHVDDADMDLKNNHHSSVAGTIGYLDPEYFKTNVVTTKSDVYSFGVVLLELFTGKPPVIREGNYEAISLIDWVKPFFMTQKFDEIMDPMLGEDYSKDVAKSIIEIALKCVRKISTQRPDMSEVVQMLFQLKPPKPDEFDFGNENDNESAIEDEKISLFRKSGATSSQYETSGSQYEMSGLVAR